MKAKLIVCGAALLLSSQALADVSAQMTLGVGYANYQYDFGDEDINTYFDFDYPYADIGLNFGISDFYANINAMLPFSEGKSSANIEFDREQYSANLGYHITSRIAAFLGANLAKNRMSAGALGAQEVTLEEIGAHIGLAGKILDFEVGAFTAKVGYSITEREETVRVDTDGGHISESRENGTGYVYGLGWVGFINKHFSYAINVDGYVYNYDKGLDSKLLTAKATLGYLF